MKKAPPVAKCSSRYSRRLRSAIACSSGGCGPTTKPALRPDAADASRSRSHSVTTSPRRAHCAASDAPMMPPPMISTSATG